MSLLVVQLQREPTLRLFSSSQIGNGWQHHLPLATESKQHRRLQRANPEPKTAFHKGYGGCQDTARQPCCPAVALMLVSCICAAGF